jgi:hypothetical protein
LPADAYFDRTVDVEGDVAAAFAAGMSSRFDSQFHTVNDIENSLHDEPLMMYTCGYWPEGAHTLEQAQQQKMSVGHGALRAAQGPVRPRSRAARSVRQVRVAQVKQGRET